ncbi:hypothetical protein KSF78_0008084 [Schistosoma japonicum]|nr:hypothetical protein KSF78_0008084 [Schistosoma japonicum]KAH8873592.1 hypothetical protein KSF78_0008084 [Schistosoma japonicum]KAH8873593.1 hypothetical protein KSF78_0008084 [Schistosoma japonicum]
MQKLSAYWVTVVWKPIVLMVLKDCVIFEGSYVKRYGSVMVISF